MFGGADYTVVLDDANDATGVYAYSASSSTHYTKTALPGIMMGATLQSVDVFHREGNNYGGDPMTGCAAYVRYGGVNIYGAFRTCPTTGLFASFTENIPTAPGGGAWTLASLDACTIGVFSQGSGSDNYHFVQELDLRVTYEPAPGGWMCIISSLVGLAALGGSLGLADMAKVADVARKQGQTIIEAHELPKLLHEMQQYRYPHSINVRHTWS